jgi:signal transduction histidine kinase/CheY-like chemotaxis protein
MEQTMNRASGASASLQPDVRVSLHPIAGALGVAGMVVIYLAKQPAAYADQVLILLIGIVLALSAPAALWLDRVSPWIGRWLAVLEFAAAFHLMALWFGAPASLILSALPVALAAALIGPRASCAVAAVQTGLVALLAQRADAGAGANSVAAAVIAIWATFAMLTAVYYPVRQLARWAWDYFERARDLEEKTMARRVELQQALDDLARANLQLTRLNGLAQGLRQMAEDARTAKEQFVANVSHELRTPLNMVTGFSEMILQSPDMYGGRLPPALLADLAVIHRNAEHLAQLIDDVLDLSQVETNQMALTKQRVSFNEIVESAALAVRPLYETKGLYLKTEAPAALPAVFCDPTRMREVVLNLLGNAGRFTETGGVTVRVRQEGGDIAVSVADTGRGITAEDLGKLFQPFQQLDSTIRRRYGGTGLGLSISRRFIELHGGTISVESAPGVGTTFTFRVPISPGAPLSDDPARWLNPDWAYLQRTHPSQAPKTNLLPRYVVCESSGDLRRLIERYLDSAEVVSVASLDESRAELEHAPAHALLINTASAVPGPDDLASLGALPKGTPVILCALPHSHGAVWTSGASARLVKPISQQALLQALEHLKITQGTLLIVDDEPDALQLYSRMLATSSRGYRVLQARDGQEALGVLHEYRPEAILLDLVMPNMDGFTLLAALRDTPSLRDIPTVIISARDPQGQPILSSALTVTQRDGISARQLLACIRAISRILAAVPTGADPEPRAVPSV